MKNLYHVIGLMSGTSLDGLDIAYCKFEKNDNNWSFELLNKKNVYYKPELRDTLKNAIHLSASELLIFNNEYGSWLGEQVKLFTEENQICVDFVSSHGHTVFHQPERGMTYQIGSGQYLSNTCKIPVVCDFRTNDVALGGQGAPLVPVGDTLLFSEYDYCLNLGGIGNISFESDNSRIAFDIVPVNMLLSHITKKIDLEYDRDGRLAKSGSLDLSLLESLNQLDFYTAPIPKSLGVEWFNAKMVPIIDASNHITIEDLLHTSIHHIAKQIASVINDVKKPGQKLLVTGGGAKNKFLIETLRDMLNQTEVVIPEEDIIDFKEAIIFAFMGVLKDRKEINCLSSVTGAKRDSSSGVFYDPQ